MDFIRSTFCIFCRTDGNFGKDTVAAVKLFQEVNGLIADGYVGLTTESVLMSSSAQANALILGSNGDTVKNMQELLKKYGYLKSADGYFGLKRGRESVLSTEGWSSSATNKPRCAEFFYTFLPNLIK